MDGSAIAAAAKEMADKKRAEEKAAWDKKMEGVERSRARTKAAGVELDQLMADFASAAPGMRYDPNGRHLFVGNCKVAQVGVYTSDDELRWHIDVYPQWPRHDRDEEIKCCNVGEFAQQLAKFASRFF